jgi:addiction module HigA family antidote
MLLEEFLKPLGISQSAFSVKLGVSFPRLNEIIRGKRAVTPDTALRLARVLGMPADFWLGLQTDGICGTRCGAIGQTRSHARSRC